MSLNIVLPQKLPINKKSKQFLKIKFIFPLHLYIDFIASDCEKEDRALYK